MPPVTRPEPEPAAPGAGARGPEATEAPAGPGARPSRPGAPGGGARGEGGGQANGRPAVQPGDRGGEDAEAGRIARIRAKLARMYPDATTALYWRTPFELLVATILSAQTTDAAVNQVTPGLFAEYPTPEAMLRLSEDELAERIKTIGLYRSKARNILATCRILVERYGGRVPRTREELVQLPGVGRKTANVVLSNAFGEPAIAVDTHVFRVARRLGLASGHTPERVEQELMEKLPREEWSRAHHWLIWHGRRICHARNPRCSACALWPECPAGHEFLPDPRPDEPPAGDARAAGAGAGGPEAGAARMPAARGKGRRR